MIEYLHGLHAGSVTDGRESTGPSNPALKPWWVVFTEAVGTETAQPARDYRWWQEGGHGVIVRLNHGYGSAGTLPDPDRYAAFARAATRAVAASRGCKIWIVGNEPNHSAEWPGGLAIPPENVAAVYAAIRAAVHRLEGHDEDLMLLPAVAPWNVESGDWLAYMERMMDQAARMGGYDGVALHTYTHGSDPALITSARTMDPPYEDRHYEFRAYREMMALVPDGTPAFITETNPGAGTARAWPERHTLWIDEAHREIVTWNRLRPEKAIRCLACYRWPEIDEWSMADKAGTAEAWEDVASTGYKWQQAEDEEEPMVIRDGFEDGFHAFGGDEHLTIPAGWGVAWVDGEKPGPVRPECKPEIKGRDKGIRTGTYGAKIAHSYSFFDAALYRSFRVPRGAVVRASAWTTAESGGLLACQVGIDPIGGGGGDFGDAEVVWGEWWGTGNEGFHPYDWHRVMAEATAESDQVTVFLRCKSDNPVQTNAGFFDDFELSYEGETPEPPTPPPSGSIQEHIDRIRAELDALEDFVHSAAVRCIVVE